MPENGPAAPASPSLHLPAVPVTAHLLAALVIAFAMYLPSLWVIRYLDRREPEPPLLFWGSIAFVILFAPITARG